MSGSRGKEKRPAEANLFPSLVLPEKIEQLHINSIGLRTPCSADSSRWRKEMDKLEEQVVELTGPFVEQMRQDLFRPFESRTSENTSY